MEKRRKIQPHRKSRRGCTNCKLRSVKCDEKTPACERCVAYGVTCSYDRTVSILRPPMESIMTPVLLPEPSYWRHPSDQILAKFQVRTAPTVSIGKRLEIYQNEVTMLASSHPFLMHVITTLTLMHDRHLSMTDNLQYCPHLVLAENYHWHRATLLFNDRLSTLRQFHGEETAASRVALLSTAAILWTISFCHIEARTSQEAWPLNSTSSSDLNWLRMNSGKEQIWKVTQSYRPDPVSKTLASMRTHEMLTAPYNNNNTVLNNIPPAFIRLFNLANYDSPQDDSIDPHYTVGVQVAQVAFVDCPIYVTILSFVSFVSGISSEVKGLLEEKDPRMLLALALWYAKLYQVGIWWMSRRLLLEGQAIRIYLKRFFSHDADIQAVLEILQTDFPLR
ncbi:hypothetical protein N7494_004692 [Penicillium frequentans]|uniref:Zn(2)-C6 fungal-type domain-containing protein n=1 Tax=Penicillium frequentans TaxID=3151616 RepID=A0AAD6GHI8_9EURO|nr:hypothetical protein N7494_004692 [Penicillium glabrum]